MKKEILIIGSGAMGTALAKCLKINNKTNVTIYGIDHHELNDLQNGFNKKYFQDLKLPNFHIEKDFKKAIINKKYVLLAIPSHSFNNVLKILEKNLNEEIIIINASKGFYPNSDIPLHEYLVQKFKENKLVKNIVTIYGPAHAEELVQEKETFVDCVSYDKKTIDEIINIFETKYFKLWPQLNVKIAQIGGIFKNIIAIACGLNDKENKGINSKAAIIYKGIIDLKVLVKYYGGNECDVDSLSVIGDIIATCFSKLSRNYSFGLNFEKNQKIIKTIEGFRALIIIEKIRIKEKLNLPFVKKLHQMIFD